MMSRRVLLVGAGADIGSNLLILSASSTVVNPITDVLTNPIESTGIGASTRSALSELVSRVILAAPHMFSRVSCDERTGTLRIDDRSFRVHFQDFESDLAPLGHFDLAILATSRRHIRSRSHLDHLERIATVVIGVAENADLPALYPALLSSPAEHFRLGRRDNVGEGLGGSYAMGSCQCAGWTVGLRLMAELAASRGERLSDVLEHSEVDIVHPDTASSSFGTTRTGPRSEDARDNLRPGRSQVADSMERFAPASTVNTVSLRVLTQPPGYQVQRFFLNLPGVAVEDIRSLAADFAAKEPQQLLVVDTPIGSRAYSTVTTSTILIAAEPLLRVQRIGPLTHVAMQGYVHNTVGYCAAILAAVDRILQGGDVTVIDSHPRTTHQGD